MFPKQFPIEKSVKSTTTFLKHYMRIQAHFPFLFSYYFCNCLRPYDLVYIIVEQHKLRINMAPRITCLEVDSYALHSVVHYTISVCPLLYEHSQKDKHWFKGLWLGPRPSLSVVLPPLRWPLPEQLVLQHIHSLSLLQFCQMV